MLRISAARVVYIVHHVPSDNRHYRYVQNILEEPTINTMALFRSDGVMWSVNIEPRHLQDDEVFLIDLSYTSSGFGGPCYKSRIVKNHVSLPQLVANINAYSQTSQAINQKLEQLKLELNTVTENKLS